MKKEFDHFELMDILDLVCEMLKEEIELDFSQWGTMKVGLPYNLEFKIRKKE